MAENHVTDHLANERTFLAWIRTCIAVMSLGFVVAKFGVWLRELAARLEPNVSLRSSGFSMPIGIGMMVLGGVMAVLAAKHYQLVSQAIERGESFASRKLVNFVTAAVITLAVVMIAYMLFTSDHL